MPMVAPTLAAIMVAPNTTTSIPSDWADAIARGDMLYTAEDALIEPTHKATIGNGYLATQMDDATLYVAGLFNGPAQAKSDVSHRAKISSPLNLHVDGGSLVGSVLDLRHAVYLRRSCLGDCSSNVEQRWWAARSHAGLLVHELVNIGAKPAAFRLRGLLAPWRVDKRDIAFSLRFVNVSVNVSGVVRSSRVSVMTGQTRVAETTTARVNVSVVTSAPLPDEAIHLAPGERRALLASVRTTLEASHPEAAALAAYASALPLAEEEEAEEAEEAEEEEKGGDRRHGRSRLFAAHTAEWAKLWRGGVELYGGRFDAATSINASLYYLLSSVRDDVPRSLSPGGLASNGYNGHSFWDCETWMLPPLLAFHPPIARSLLEYRYQRLDGARAKARSYTGRGYRGAMFPWESAASGVEVCPSSAPTGQLEQHITGDIALAVRQVYAVTADRDWLRQRGFALLAGSADFWVSRVEADRSSVAHINGVIPPDEYRANGVNDSVYTNAVARIALDAATRAAALLGVPADPLWQNVSNRIPILFDKQRGAHPEYDGYQWGTTIKQADAVLLAYPLMLNMSDKVRAADLAAYEPVTDSNGPAMTWGMHAVGHLDGGNISGAARLFNRSFADNVKGPFKIWTETPKGGTTNFLTGAGGFLQTVLAGYAGMRILPDRLRLRPRLIEGTAEMRVRGLAYRGFSLDMRYSAANVTFTLKGAPDPRSGRRSAAASLEVTDVVTSQGHSLAAPGDTAQFKLRPAAAPGYLDVVARDSRAREA